MSQPDTQVFISHIHEDVDYARAIAKWLQAIPNCEVKCFVSTDESCVSLGVDWSEQIRLALGGSAIVLVLVSPVSASRRWIYFEAGAGFVKGIPVVPVCIAGLARADLDPPLSFLESIQLPSRESERQLLRLIASKAGLETLGKHRALRLPRRRPGKGIGPHRSLRDSGAVRVFRNPDDNALVDLFKTLVSRAERVVLVGTGLNLLFQRFHREPLDLLDAKQGQHWEIYLANPYAPEVEVRLIEEETGRPTPPVGKTGLIRRLDALLAKQKAIGNKQSISVGLFSHYPTISFFIVDEHYFFYPYGYSRLGDSSPVIYSCAHVLHDTPLIDFLKDQYRLVKEKSIDARLVHALHSRHTFDLRERRRIRERLFPVAVYIVPEKDTDLYRFGTECLGYDLRGQKPVKSPWQTKHVRAGAEFGFHLTVADAQYFAGAESVGMLTRELEALAKEFQSFQLNFELTVGFPDASSVSLVCRDETGTLEALHHEMVCRCYRRAVASNYSQLFGEEKAGMNRSYAKNALRNDLMIERYRAPYILNEFRPHFSLLANVEKEHTSQVIELLGKKLPASPFWVNGICLLTRPKKSPHWKILEEFSLGPKLRQFSSAVDVHR